MVLLTAVKPSPSGDVLSSMDEAELKVTPGLLGRWFLAVTAAGLLAGWTAGMAFPTAPAPAPVLYAGR
jgi:hypothetical protein